MKRVIPVTAVWLRRIGDDVQLLVEVNGRGWVLAVTEHCDGPFSHIAEGNGADRWPPDPIASPDHDEYARDYDQDEEDALWSSPDREVE